MLSSLNQSVSRIDDGYARIKAIILAILKSDTKAFKMENHHACRSSVNTSVQSVPGCKSQLELFAILAEVFLVAFLSRSAEAFGDLLQLGHSCFLVSFYCLLFITDSTFDVKVA